MKYLIFEEVEESFDHLVEEEEEGIEGPLLVVHVFVDEVFEASVFVVGGDEYIAADVGVIEAVIKFQNILGLCFDHVAGLFLDGIQVELGDLYGLDCQYFG